MAPSASATQSQVVNPKVKRPIPPGIQTNGINSSTSSPSPSISNGKLPTTAKLPPNSATSNGAGSSSSGPRSASRVRRDAPAQLLGRGQRISSVGLRSASLVGNSSIAHTVEPQPYIKTDEYILRKYRGCPPSLIVHMHPTHFRFDQQEGSFKYNSPMRVLIQHIRERTIPHDLVEFFNDVPYYEGCMIVQVHDHKSIAASQDTDRPKSAAGKTTPFSIHNYNVYLTPSPYVPYPTEVAVPGKGKGADDDSKKKDKENMPAPDLPKDPSNKQQSSPKQPKIATVVLRPTALSNYADFAVKAGEAQPVADGRRDSRQDGNGAPLSATVPPTPTTAVPPTPQTSMAPPAKRLKKTHPELTSSNIYAAESQITFATTAPLMLEPVNSVGEAVALLDSLAHPMHSEAPPAPKTRKRTVAEMAADEAQAAEQERHMLTFDERLGPNTARAQGGGNAGDGVGQAGGISFEPRFERFKTIEIIKAQHEETKRAEKLRREEAERKTRQEQERNKLRDEAEKREQEKARVLAQQQMANRQQLQAENQRRQMASQAQAGLQGPNHLPQGNQPQTQHAHPQTNGLVGNGLAAQPQRFHQQVSQAQASSPIVRNGTPHSHSSPAGNQMGNVPMQQTTSSMGGSPPRPGSVVHQNHPQMGAPTGHPMSAQRSQQSHAGTPRMPNSTPNIQSTPLNRQVNQAPRMSQGSPMQASMAGMQGMQGMQGMPMMNGQQMPVMNSQQAMQLQQQQQNRIMQAQAMRTGGLQQQQAMGGMVPQQMTTQQQHHYLAAQQMMRAQAQQGGNPNTIAQAYASQMNAMAQRSGGLPPNMNQNMMNNGMPQMTMQQMQQQLQIRQMQQQGQGRGQQTQQMQQQQIFQQQVIATATSMYNNERLKTAANYPNGILPEEVERNLRVQCQRQATENVQRRIQMSRNHQAQQQNMMAQAQAAQAQGMQQNMNGMQGGMGM
ncbi:hypothetical protein WAI453_008549 [Rhynchosporium graminicola]|uniref:Spt20-like SEP domain-containing protein n=1 Tax=Rhynchosporium graminicola TaxID=2792576 RepID=A0A1E1KH12_9HELO|nr:uncharacterized protein RCO7_00290 [Rhynchosporium commune]